MNVTRISERHRRTFFVGLNTGYVEDGTPDERMVAFYKERSSPRLSCAIVGNVVLPGGDSVNSVTARMSRDPRWKRLASVIPSRGTTPGLQLATAWQNYEGATSFRPKDWMETIAKSRALAAAVGPLRLQQLFSGLSTGTEMAAEAGYRHIQLHAAHGYLFSLTDGSAPLRWRGRLSRTRRVLGKGVSGGWPGDIVENFRSGRA
jgi:2,4-dienoyl-CoA reductase-like NADH-dependent reductase (Old Yellow Enzyme family)